MKNRIEQRFEDLKAKNETAFIPFITAGDPTLAQTEAIIHALERAGADVLELGVPFSDPVGDGPAIQLASQRALMNNVTTPDIFALVKRVRATSELPILLFSYFNPLLAYGLERFAREAAAAGADGVLCVDLPPEEADDYKAALDAAGMCTVFLTAPTTTNARLEMVGKQCSGFVYYVSQMGVTGERTALATDLRDAVARIKQHTGKPVAVGFGISTPEQAREVSTMAEGVVVGSAIVRLIGQLGESADTAAEVEAFAKSLANAAKGR